MLLSYPCLLGAELQFVRIIITYCKIISYIVLLLGKWVRHAANTMEGRDKPPTCENAQ